MDFKVSFSPGAEKAGAKLDKPVRDRVRRLIARIGADPFFPGTEQVVTRPGLRRARAGDYRVLYAVDVAAGTVEIEDIELRGSVYRHRKGR